MQRRKVRAVQTASMRPPQNAGESRAPRNALRRPFTASMRPPQNAGESTYSHQSHSAEITLQ